jgi:drug/metabolite transporter (DMT)-like permease
MTVEEFTPYKRRMASSRRAVGLGLAVTSAAAFGTSGSFADSLMSTGWTPGAVVTARILLAAILLTPLALLQLRGRWPQLRASAGPIAVYGLVAVAGCQFAFFNAVQHLEVGVALLLEYLGIVLVVLWLWLRHAQRPRRLTLAGIVAAVAGLVLVLDPSGGVNGVGVFWGLLAATGLAVFFVLSARMDAGLPPLAVAWGGMVVGALTLVAAGLTGALPWRASTADVALFGRELSWVVPVVGLSLVAAALSYSLGVAAARLLGAKVASFVGLTEVLFAVLFAALLVDQVPTAAQVLGGAVVLLGVALVQADDAAGGSAAEPDGAVGAIIPQKPATPEEPPEDPADPAGDREDAALV